MTPEKMTGCCLVCGVAISRSRPYGPSDSMKFCSRQCAARSPRTRRRLPPPPFPRCVVCAGVCPRRGVTTCSSTCRRQKDVATTLRRRRLYPRPRVMPRVMNCQSCGVVIQRKPRRADAMRFCSRRCAGLMSPAGGRPRRLTRPYPRCVVCAGVCPHRGRVTCSAECKQVKQRGDRRLLTVPLQAQCPACRSAFHARNKDHVYCSARCARRMRKLRARLGYVPFAERQELIELVALVKQANRRIAGVTECP